MRVLRLILLIVCGATGCYVPIRTELQEIPESAVRRDLKQTLPKLVVDSMKRDGWTAKIVSKNQEALVSQNVGEAWQDLHFVFDLETEKDQEIALLPTQAYLPSLRNLRTKFKDLVEQLGGEQIDYTYSEAYKERSLEFLYSQDKLNGKMVVRLTPLRDAPEEVRTRIDIVIREQTTE